MSINSEHPCLNNAGLALQGSLASFIVNGLVHPICTVKNRQMAAGLALRKALTPIQGLYNGYLAISCVESITFTTIYVTNNFLKGRVSDLTSSVMAGLISSPIVSFGEGFMTNRQVNALPYSQIFKRAIRPVGLITTALRETPFSMAVFYFTPILERKFQKISPRCEESIARNKAIELASGVIAGAIAGFLTTPVDLINTRVQTNQQPLSIMKAVSLTCADTGLRALFRGCGARAFYLALAVAGMNIVNHAIPPLLPMSLHSNN